VVISVSDLDSQRSFLEQVAGWTQLDRGPLSHEILNAWGLDEAVTAEQVLMGNPGTQNGYVRLVRFAGAPQQQIRSSAQPWESGGILDINVRVLDMDRKFKQMQDRGWYGFSDPVHYTFGPFEVKEWVSFGPDGASFALIERIKPELEGWPELREFSRAFNSTQVVRDMPAALHFYRDILGFQKYIYHSGPSEKPGPSVLGLPHNLATEINREVWVLHPTGTNEGSVELLQFDGLYGRDFAERAHPPNLGILMLRFPVKGLDALVGHLRDQGVSPVPNPLETKIAPWGTGRQVMVQAPDGALLDFYEPDGD
jgi:catechol 2,3-dioxygenase-like lactoylglutathione lyase family enzyme